MIKGWQLTDYNDLAVLLGVKPKSLTVMRCQGKSSRVRSIPEPIRTISKSPVWDTATIGQWWASLRPILRDLDQEFELYKVTGWFAGSYTLLPIERTDRVLEPVFKVTHEDLINQLGKPFGGYLLEGFKK